MNRTAILAILGVTILAGGTALAASDPPERPVPLLAAGTAEHEDEPADAHTTTTTEATTTTASLAEPTTTTAPPRPPTTTTAPPRPAVAPLHLRCTGDGMRAANGTGERTEAWVYCELAGVDRSAASLSLTRDGETIARTADTSVTSYKDREVRAGQTYSYQAHTFTADGTLLQSSEAVRATASGGSQTYDGPLVLRCGGSMRSASTTSEPMILCTWKGIPERAAHLTLTRDGTVIVRTDDVTMSHHEDRDVTPGTTYAYEVHAYAADGTLIESSGAVRATPDTAL